MAFFSEFWTGTSKLVDSRPPALAKFLPNSQELGNTSSSEGEKDSPPPEWDSVPVHKPGSCKYGAPHSRSASGSGRENCRASCQQRRPRVCVPEPVSPLPGPIYLEPEGPHPVLGDSAPAMISCRPDPGNKVRKLVRKLTPSHGCLRRRCGKLGTK